MKKLVSIIIPTFNRASIIGNTLNSILEQSHENWECIVIDDGSSDYTKELMEYYINKDHRIKYHHRPLGYRKGGNGARNYGFTLAKGDYILFFDSDDLMLPVCVEKKIKMLEEGFDVCISRLQFFSIRNGDIEPGGISDIESNDIIYDMFAEKIAIPTGNALLKAGVLDNEPFDEELSQSQDLDLFARIFKDHKVFTINEVLFLMRQGHESISSRYENRITKYLNSYLKVRQDALKNFSNHQKFRELIIGQVLGLLRYAISMKNYKAADRIISFLKRNFNGKGRLKKYKLFRITFFYHFFKIIGRGETRFKYFLKL